MDSVVTGVAEIVLSVRDLPLMRAFYQDVLGFEFLEDACHELGPDPEPGGQPTIAFLTIKALDTPLGQHGHPQLLALIDYQRHVFARPRFDGHEPSKSTLNHLAFEIPPGRYNSERQRLTTLGLAPETTRFPAMSARALFFSDPEGNLLEFSVTTTAKTRKSNVRK